MGPDEDGAPAVTPRPVAVFRAQPFSLFRCLFLCLSLVLVLELLLVLVL